MILVNPCNIKFRECERVSFPTDDSSKKCGAGIRGGQNLMLRLIWPVHLFFVINDGIMGWNTRYRE